MRKIFGFLSTTPEIAKVLYDCYDKGYRFIGNFCTEKYTRS